MIDKKEIRKDKWLKILMKTGLPLALISIISLWVGHFSTSEIFGKLFLVTMPLALVIGFAYNVRYVVLSIREQKKQSALK